MIAFLSSFLHPSSPFGTVFSLSKLPLFICLFAGLCTDCCQQTHSALTEKQTAFGDLNSRAVLRRCASAEALDDLKICCTCCTHHQVFRVCKSAPLFSFDVLFSLPCPPFCCFLLYAMLLHHPLLHAGLLCFSSTLASPQPLGHYYSSACTSSHHLESWSSLAARDGCSFLRLP